MARPSAYNWSDWDRNSIIDMVYMMRDDLVGQSMPVSEFHDKLTKHIKHYMPIRSRKSFESQVDPQFVWVGGCYYSDYDKNRTKSIELQFAYSKKDQGRHIKITTRRFTRVCYRVADVLLHEVIHMRQARRRNFKNLPGYQSTAESTKQRVEQEYLGDNDEIDAYAYNMACELHDKFYGNITEIVAYLNEEQKGKRRHFNTWRTYLKAFNWDQNHRIIRRIKKRCIYYLDKSDINRPIHAKDWITR